MSTALIAVGGTGQHVALAALRLHALGALTPDLELVVIDGDGASPITRRLEQPWPRGETETHPLRLGRVLKPYDPSLGSIKFTELFVDANHPFEAELFRAFFAEDEGNVRIADGMQARPMVGATVISEGMKTDGMREEVLRLGAHDPIFVCGSLIGGTGAGVAHKLLGAIRRQFPKKRLHAVLFTQWFVAPPDPTIGGLIPLNEGHGLEFVFRHTLPLVESACIIGVPTQAGAAKLLGRVQGPSGEECPSYLHLLAARALFDLPAKHTAMQDRKVWAYAHDDAHEDWLLGEKWEGGETLQKRYNAAVAAQKLCAFTVSLGNDLKVHTYPSMIQLWGSPDAISRPLYDSIRNHGGNDRARGFEYIDRLLERLRSHVARYEFARSWLVGHFPRLETGHGATPWLRNLTEKAGDDKFMADELGKALGTAVERADPPLGASDLADRLVKKIEAASLNGA